MSAIRPAEWRANTPEAINRRLWAYLWWALSLKGNRKEPFRTVGAPEWPAVWMYDEETDQPMWIEIEAPMHAVDFMRVFPERINAAARELAERASEIWAHEAVHARAVG